MSESLSVEMLSTIVLWLFLFSPPAPGAPTPPPSSLQGFKVLPQDSLKSFRLMSHKQDAHLEIIRVQGQPFQKVFRVKTHKKPAKIYHIQLNAKIPASIEKEDLLFLTFYVRGSRKERTSPEMEFVFERAGGSYKKSIRFPCPVSSSWEKMEIPFLAAERYNAGEAQINFRLGFDPQTVEIGGIDLINYKKSAALNELPMTRLTYLGREEQATWRQQALKRIDSIRKSTLHVLVEHPDGKTISGAQVHVKMLRHAFGFGSALNGRFFLSSHESSNGKMYRQIFLELFNKAVLENSMKWTFWKKGGKEQALQAVQWLREHDIPVRGHTLLWPAWNHLPESLLPFKNNPAALRQQIREHVVELVSTFRGQLVEWDVLNELYANHDLTDILGLRSIVEWFHLARQTDPTAQFYINDYGVLNDTVDSRHLGQYKKTIQYLLDHQAPLDGIGVQGHFDWELTPPQQLLQNLKPFVAFGKPIEITEFDVDITDEGLQADYLRDFMTAMFSHPAVHGIMLWGFWEGVHSSPRAALFRRDWTLRPCGKTWIDLVFNRWWTDERGATNEEGRFVTRGFLGNYELEITYQGETKRIFTSLPKEGREIKVVF
ncbi:MAG: endo-1,4-beta-xylanase [Elusimicrobia bacterium]|nr:endo-1,4-beta-xylanase [Elusimicrobiota bacterium]